MTWRVELADNGAVRAVRALAGRLRDLSPASADIAALGEASTRMRFRTQTAPDGTTWKPSLRAKLTGGRTLTLSGHLADSLSSRAGPDFAEWGVNRIYAAVHQFGAVIRPVRAKALRFRLASGDWAMAQQVTIPARPYLGLSDDDAGDVLDILQRYLGSTLDAAGA